MSKFDKKIPMESVPNGHHKLPCAVAIGGLSVNLNHLKSDEAPSNILECKEGKRVELQDVGNCD